MIGRVCWRFGEVESTQNVAFRLGDLGAPHGTVVRAEFQSAGRGRQGRMWEAARGASLMFSTILRPTFPLHELGSISILMADALVDVLESRVDAPIHIKWPNDVLIDGEKASGILLQTRSGPEPLAVPGIGINVDASADSLPVGRTNLSQHAHVDADLLFTDLMHRLNEMWDGFRPELSDGVVSRLESRLWQMGEEVSIIDAEREIQGRILGVAKNGGLRLSVEGSERVVVAGEIVRGPRPI